MSIWDFLSYTVPSQEVEISIKPMFGNRYIRYTTDTWDEIRNDDGMMEYLKAVKLANFAVFTDGILHVFGIEA